MYRFFIAVKEKLLKGSRKIDFQVNKKVVVRNENIYLISLSIILWSLRFFFRREFITIICVHAKDESQILLICSLCKLPYLDVNENTNEST